MSILIGIAGVASVINRSIEKMTYKGGCHCGRVAFEVEGDLGQIIECNCSHCSKKA